LLPSQYGLPRQGQRTRKGARALRGENRTLAEIAEILGVSKSSVPLWVRDIDVEIRRQKPVARRANSLHVRKVAEIDASNEAGIARIGAMSDQAFLSAGTALYAGEGAKRDGSVRFANTDPAMVRFFCAWLRRFFAIDETRLRVRVYLHEGLDLDAAERFWSDVTAISRSQFGAAYRAKADPTIRSNKHQHGCAYVIYSCSRTHREIMGLVRALLSSGVIPG
jgi:hypothetical protein